MLFTLFSTLLISNSLTIAPIGLTFHGLKPNGNVPRIMDNKLTSNGRVAYNPQVGLIYKTKDWQFAGAYLQDCFNNPAGLLMAGPKWDLGNYFSVGAVGGLYARKDPIQTIHQTDSHGYQSADVVKPEDLPISKKIGGAEIAPFGGLTGSVELPVTKNASIETNVLVNYVMNHANLGVKIKW